ncbi:MAG: branched-chain amino acid ABC transporter permease [Rhodospirillales bacterium]|jgi:branched-chain amino acid transport system permease protein|nr:branched-chain amino acid ABC transporter permease [Rhodospirillales bacterium]MDP6774807.1 branched-chain amino acid ABC transporter permease [Rhodospirillales bacterium]
MSQALKRKLADPRTGGLLGLAAVIAVLPLFLPNNFYYDVAIGAGLSAIVCVGLNLLIGYAGQISLGHAGFVGLGAYSSAVLTVEFGWHPLAAMTAGALGVGILAFLVARPILRLRGHYLAMATLGLGIIISIVVNTEAEYTGGPDGMTVPSLMFFGRELYGEAVWYWIVGAALLFTVWLSLNLIASPVGRALRAVHGSEPAAEIAGVDTAHYKVLVFVISAVIASLAGSLGAHYAGFVSPANVGFFRSIELVTMVVLGGMASTYGAVVGAAILTVLPQLLTGLEDYEHIAFGLILMLTVIFMPRGLVPSFFTIARNRLASAGAPPP